MTPARDPRLEALLNFWFGPARTDSASAGERMGLWFTPSQQQDEEVVTRFGDLPGLAATGVFDPLLADAASRLAVTLICDQLPRVLHRGSAAAFTCDYQAQALSLGGIVAGLDRRVSLCERAFFYLPLEHAEDPVLQDLSVARFEQLASEWPTSDRHGQGFLEHARQHRDIVLRFGRFPHRNRALGRESTTAERAYLQGGGSTFGQ